VFGALEDEVVRILRANLSPDHLPAARVVPGPVTPPSPSDPPFIAVTAGSFRLNPDEAASPPRGTRTPVADAFPPNGVGPLSLSRAPLPPLRLVEVEDPPGSRAALRERDDYIVDYVNGRLRLRQSVPGTLHVQYFTSEPFRVTTATRLRVDFHVDVFGAAAPGVQSVDTLSAIAMGAIGANANGFDGLRGEGDGVPETGVGAREVFFVFEIPVLVGGAQPLPTQWRLDYAVDAWMILLPVDEPLGRMRHIAAGLAWDDRLVESLLSSPPPILGRPVTIIQGVGPATAATLAERGISRLGQLADAAPIGTPAIDQAIERAQTVRLQAGAAARGLVEARPTIADSTQFFDLRLAELDAADLAAVGIGAGAAAPILAAVAGVVAETTLPALRVADLLPAP
jgi:hypothetical protein